MAGQRTWSSKKQLLETDKAGPPTLGDIEGGDLLKRTGVVVRPGEVNALDRRKLFDSVGAAVRPEEKRRYNKRRKDGK